ncbi:MAG: non-homologous end-joining DNA ligase [Actinomycetota bacterium]
MPKKASGPAFTVEFPKALPVERHGEAWVFTDGDRQVRLSNLTKVFWADEGYTKGDLLAYYYNVADRILPYLKDRPLTMKRMPDGAFGEFFYEKNAPPYTPSWIRGCCVESTGDGGRWGRPRDPRQARSSREKSPNKDWIQYLMVDGVDSLLFVVNMGCIEFHPLHSRCGQVERPDYLFFDLDPFDVPYETVLKVALMVKVVCDQFDLRSYPKTSGATGLQVYVPIHPDYTYTQIRDFVGAAGHMIRKVDPGSVTMEWEVRKRTGRVFIDHQMNRAGANISSAYSVRPEPGATVSTPLAWEEVEAGEVRPSDFTIANVWDRFAAHDEDPFLPVLGADQDLTPALEALGIPVEDDMPPTESFLIPLPPTEDPRAAAASAARALTGADHQTDSRSGRRRRPAASGRKRGGTTGEASDDRRTRTNGASATGATRQKSDEVIARSRDPQLRKYLTMRDFEATPEPAGGRPSETGNSFVIQKHDATRLHYDVRLEKDGVLVSWAVPRGLPFERGDRRLAVHTEDHPMEYATFAGTIPKGHYGAGAVVIWDRGTYDELEWTDKKVSFRLHGERHRGEFHLVKTGREQDDWLVFLSKPPEREELPPAPAAMLPMLATGGAKPFDDPAWVFEPKLDGIRCLVYTAMDSTMLVSRTGRDQTASYPELNRLHNRVTAVNAVVDGEIVAMDARGRPSFERLQQRMNLASPSEIERAKKTTPVELFAFDLLWLDGEDLTHRPQHDRRALLDEIAVPGGKGLNLTVVVEAEGRTFYEQARKFGFEGVMAKRVSSRYTPGKRTPDWRKIKILNRQDAVILGWTPGQGGRGSSFGALLLGAYRDGDLVWIGQVGTGFTDATINDLMNRLKERQIDKPAIADRELRKVKGACWVRPELVADVEYLQMTSGGKLRAPSFKGLRTDKLPEDCILEPPAPQ